MIPFRPPPEIRRLWWRCTICRWKVDTFGKSHDDRNDRVSLGWEVLDHLQERHGIRVLSVLDALAYFEPAGAVRPRKPRVLVPR